MARSPLRFVPRVARLEDRVTPVAAVNDLSGLQGDFDLTDGIADVGQFDPGSGKMVPSGVVTLNAALQQAEYNFLNGNRREVLTFDAAGTLSQTIAADFPPDH